ncbi:membrane protein RL11J [Cercopithecine betaherpesvirus 5]|uniref:Membrane protein RL11J n=1 Tax=Simian cytomegalovirus (strain Colburn) TaxID=50292 RepID=G8XT77_SCMVC|nr:membrane protein RL11J [Cercopithecine betaherpesvirus 5]AEV80370.1 membrane protein RL11J [Cercopithecine betaherpesvirus 5]
MAIAIILIITMYHSQGIFLPTCTPKTCCEGDELVLESHIPNTCNVTAWYRYRNNTDILLCWFSGAFVNLNFRERISSTCSRQSFTFYNIRKPSAGTYYTVGDFCNQYPKMLTCYNVTVNSRTTVRPSTTSPSAAVPLIQAYSQNNTRIEEPVEVHGAWGLVIVALLALWLAIEFRLPQKLLRYCTTRTRMGTRLVQTV